MIVICVIIFSEISRTVIDVNHHLYGNKFDYLKKFSNAVSCFGVRVSVMFHFMFVHYTFSSVWVAEWPPFWK